jgi:hypothetical protein
LNGFGWIPVQFAVVIGAGVVGLAVARAYAFMRGWTTLKIFGIFGDFSTIEAEMRLEGLAPAPIE